MSKSTKPAWLFPSEFEIASWPAAIPTRRERGAAHGGRLHLTSHRLVWRPLPSLAVPVGDAGLLPFDPTQPWEVPLTRIARVVAVPGRRALLEVVAVDGRARRFLVGAGRFAPVWSRRNTIARDEAVARIDAARSGAWSAVPAQAGGGRP